MTKTNATTEPAAPRKFDNFAARLNVGLPKREASTRQTSGGVAAAAASTARPVSAASSAEMPPWAREAMNAYFAGESAEVPEAVGKKTEADARAAETSKRTSADRWERANAKVEAQNGIVRRVSHRDGAGGTGTEAAVLDNGAPKSASERWDKLNRNFDRRGGSIQGANGSYMA